MGYLLWEPVRSAAEKAPDRVAVVDGNVETNYETLVRRADAVASLLVREGLQPGDRVGILATKSWRCVAGMLGVLRAGGCYVPIDPKAPSPRVRYVLDNARAVFLLTELQSLRTHQFTPGVEGVPSSSRTLLLDEGSLESGALGYAEAHSWSSTEDQPHFVPPLRNEFDPAYILYTSGSTGRPKGVVISHRNALTFVDWGRKAFGVTSEDRLSNHAPFHFDLSVFDLYAALSTGASVHLVPDRVAPFARELAAWIAEHRISVWYSVPSALVRLLLHGDVARFDFRDLRTILFAGEVFPVKHLRDVMKAFGGAEFHNLYGPTETNVCTHYPVPRPLPDDVQNLSIGKACPNMEVIVVSDSGGRANVGEEGELVVRGPCVMLGYWGLADRTADSIVQNPTNSDFIDPVYKTGDRVRLSPDGNLEFLGRRDHMVKVRGYRIELGEVEQALHEHARIREAAVVPVEDGEVGTRLHAAVVLNGAAAVEADEILRHCLERLPRYAVPESVRFFDELPRTSTGKTDRMQLLARLTSRPDAQE